MLHQLRLTRVATAALAALVLAAPAAAGAQAKDHGMNAATGDAARSAVRTSSLAGTTSASTQDLRSPDARDAGHPSTPSDVKAALAQERYYSSYGRPTPIPSPAVQVAGDDGIATLPFALAMFGALMLGLGAGGALHLLHVRRHRAGLVT
jgi:hypothetical protein